MDHLISLVGSIVLLLLVGDGIAYMFGARFPFLRGAFRLARRAIGGIFIGIGRWISGGGRRTAGGRR